MRAWLGVVVLCAGCARLPEGVLFRCTSDAECAGSERCLPIDGVSYCVAPDAGAVDGGAPTDAGRTDAGPSDGGVSDSGVPDGGPEDAGSSDAGAPDGGADDAGSSDGGPIDAGTVTEICNESSCNGQTCGTVIGSCVCGCSPGLTCDGQACIIPTVCAVGWCYEHPRPQGGHLTAAWASRERPLRQGQLGAVWGGERGILFEWDGLRTTPTQLPSFEGDVIGFFETDAGLHAITTLASVFRRDATTWSLAPHLAPETVIPRDGGASSYRPCSAFGRTQQGNFLGCTTASGDFDILRVDARQFVSEPVFQLPDAGPARAVTVSDVGNQVLFSVGVPGNATLLRRADGGWSGSPAANANSPFSAFATTATTLYATFQFGGWATSPAFTTDAGLYEFRWAGDTFLGTAAVPIGGFTAFLGDGIATLGPNGFLQQDGGLLIARDPSSLHTRRWLAGAAMPEGVLAVGAFGATAFFRTNGVATLASSTFAARPSGLCGTVTSDRVYVSTSAAWLEPSFDRPIDVLRLKETDGFKGVMRRTSSGVWVPVPDARGRDAGWSNSIDQCAIDRAGNLHTASPLGFSSFLADGGSSFLFSGVDPWLDAGIPYLPALRSFVAEGPSFIAGGGETFFSAEGSTMSRTRTPFGFCHFATIGAERVCAGDQYQSQVYRSFAGDGVSYTSDSLPNNLTTRAGLVTRPLSDGGEEYVVLAQSPLPRASVLLTRPPCQQLNGCGAFRALAGASRALGVREGVSNLAAGPDGRLLWLRATGERKFDGLFYFVDRDLSMTVDWLERDGGVGTIPVPGFIYDQRFDVLPFELFATSNRVLLMTTRGVIATPRP